MISRNFSGIMGFIKSLAKAVWAFCSYLFGRKRINVYDTEKTF